MPVTARTKPKAEINATVADIADKAVLAQQIRDIEGAGIKLSGVVVEHTIAIAKILGGARPFFKHGEWGQWLKSEFKWSDRTSARYWSVFKLTEHVADLDQLQISVSVLYKLAELRATASKNDAFDKIVALARTQRVTVDIAEDIISEMMRTRVYPNMTVKEEREHLEFGAFIAQGNREDRERKRAKKASRTLQEDVAESIAGAIAGNRPPCYHRARDLAGEVVKNSNPVEMVLEHILPDYREKVARACDRQAAQWQQLAAIYRGKVKLADVEAAELKERETQAIYDECGGPCGEDDHYCAKCPNKPLLRLVAAD